MALFPVPSFDALNLINQSLIDSVVQCNAEHTKILLATGVQVNFRDATDKTALFWAAKKGHSACLVLLVDHGADINAECDGQTPLVVAIRKNRVTCTKILLEKGAIIDPPNSNDMGVPMEEAIFNNRVKCLSLLIENGAKVNSRDRQGYTPLHQAANFGSVECVTILLKNGADVNAKSLDNKSPFDVAREKNKTDICDLFVNYMHSQNRSSSPSKLGNHFQSQISYSDISSSDYSQSPPVISSSDISQHSQSSYPEAHCNISLDYFRSPCHVISYSDISTVPTIPISSQDPSSQPSQLSQHPSSQTSQLSQHSQISSTPQYLNPTRKPNYVTPNLEIDYADLEIMEEIGAGFYGKVSKAIWQEGTPVAVKHLKVASADGKIDELTKHRFRLEMEMLMALRHPNIVLFLGVCIHPPNFLLICEYLPRGSLYDVLHKCPVGKVLSHKGRLQMSMDVACGMNYLHKQAREPILHRDLKSTNLLVTEDFHVKVSDFGLARVKDSTSFRRTPLDISIQAPEVLRSKGQRYIHYTEKSDVFSYGLLLWEIFCHAIPFEGVDPQHIAAKVLSKTRPEVPPSLPLSLRGLMTRCWDEDPQVRPAFQEIVRELRVLVKQ